MDKNLKLKINETIRHIFKDVDLSSLSAHQKRQTIFSYLCGCLKYDFDLLEKIHNNADMIIIFYAVIGVVCYFFNKEWFNYLYVTPWNYIQSIFNKQQ